MVNYGNPSMREVLFMTSMHDRPSVRVFKRLRDFVGTGFLVIQAKV